MAEITNFCQNKYELFFILRECIIIINALKVHFLVVDNKDCIEKENFYKIDLFSLIHSKLISKYLDKNHENWPL